MKKLSIALSSLFVAALLFTGCSSDDVKDLVDPNSPLIGTTWTETTESRSGCTDPNDNKATENCNTGCTVLVFNSDGTITFSSGGPGEATTYTSTGSTITATWDEGGTPVSLQITYTIVLNVCTLTYTEDGCTVVETYTGS